MQQKIQVENEQVTLSFLFSSRNIAGDEARKSPEV